MANVDRMRLWQAIGTQLGLRDIVVALLGHGLQWRRPNGIYRGGRKELGLLTVVGGSTTTPTDTSTRSSVASSTTSAPVIRSIRRLIRLIRSDCVRGQRWPIERGRARGVVSQLARVKVLEAAANGG